MIRRGLRALHLSARAPAAAFENPAMRRVQLAWAGISFSLWSFSIALGVYAFEVGGATAVGIAGLVRLLPGALASPFAGLLGDTHSRRAVLIASAGAGAALLAAATALAALDAGAAAVFGVAGLFMVVLSPYVPAESALLPAIARTPQELSAANVAHSTMDNLGFLAGSLLSGLLLASTSPTLVFAVAAGVAVAVTLLLFGLPRDRRPEYAGEIKLAGAFRHSMRGVVALTGDPGLRLLAVTLTLLEFFVGAADVIVVVVALDLLELGAGSVGYLNASWGVGALVGGLALAVLLDRGKLALGLAAGSVALGVLTALPAAWPVSAATYAAWFGIGIGFTFVETAARTLIQRLGSDETLARVFGVLETSRLTAMALGAIAVPLAVEVLGIRGALVALAAMMPAFAFLRWAALRNFETGAPVAERPYALLRANPIFEALPIATLERLSHDAIRIETEAGEEIISQGERGDRFYLIDSGEVEVLTDGNLRGHQVAGDGFGEIALLRECTRTATVRATRTTRLFALERERFIAAVTGHGRSLETAHAVADERVPVERRPDGRIG